MSTANLRKKNEGRRGWRKKRRRALPPRLNPASATAFTELTWQYEHCKELPLDLSD